MIELYGNEPQLIESIYQDPKEKNYYIKGKFATIEQVNQNKRIYPRHLWEREVAKYQNDIKQGNINTLMEWEHPLDRSNVDPIKAVAKIQKLWIENNYVMGEAIILDTPQAEIIKSLIKNRIRMSVSSRGTGQVDSQGYVTDFNLITFDIVACPSDQSATMYGVYESIENKKMETIHLTKVGNVIMEDINSDEFKKLNENITNLKNLMPSSIDFKDVTKDQENILSQQINVLESLEKISNNFENVKSVLKSNNDFEIKEKRYKNIIDSKNSEVEDLKEELEIALEKQKELQKNY